MLQKILMVSTVLSGLLLYHRGVHHGWIPIGEWPLRHHHSLYLANNGLVDPSVCDILIAVIELRWRTPACFSTIVVSIMDGDQLENGP